MGFYIEIPCTIAPYGQVKEPLKAGKCVSLLEMLGKFSGSRIEYPLRGSSKKGSHVYLLLLVFWVILLICHKSCSYATMVI